MMPSEIGTSMLTLARAQRVEGAAEERLAGIGRGRQRDRADSQWNRSRVSGVMSVTLPDQTETDSSMMFIAAKPATARQRSRNFDCCRLAVFARLHLERIGAIAHLFQRADGFARIEAGSVPGQRQPLVGEIQARVADAVERFQRFLDLADAAAAMDAVDHHVHAGGAVRERDAGNANSRAARHGSFQHQPADASDRAATGRASPRASASTGRAPHRWCRGTSRPTPVSMRRSRSSREFSGCTECARRPQFPARRPVSHPSHRR